MGRRDRQVVLAHLLAAHAVDGLDLEEVASTEDSSPSLG
jgi:hypothetical protein